MYKYCQIQKKESIQLIGMIGIKYQHYLNTNDSTYLDNLNADKKIVCVKI